MTTHSAALHDAQARADRIRSFRCELAAIEQDGAVLLAPAQRDAIARYHDTLLAQLAREYDIDRTAGEHQLSLGLRVVSVLGALAFCASAYCFLERVWGRMPLAAQLAVAWAAPIPPLLAAAFAFSRERRPYFTSILSFVAFGCFVANISAGGQALNAIPSAGPFLAWGLFAAALAYAWNLKGMLAVSAVCLVIFGGAMQLDPVESVGAIAGRPESLFLPALALLAWSASNTNATRSAFPAILRGIGATAIFTALLLLSASAPLSAIAAQPAVVKATYQALMVAVSGLAIWAAVKCRWTETLELTAVSFGVFLLIRFVDWFWAWMRNSLDVRVSSDSAARRFAAAPAIIQALAPQTIAAAMMTARADSRITPPLPPGGRQDGDATATFVRLEWLQLRGTAGRRLEPWVVDVNRRPDRY
jgi:hypothetical protein